MKRTCKQLRSEFIAFFEQRGHTVVPSSSLLPADDPTLLFANAGMNQFKPIFLGTEKRDYVRAANTQKCIRAGGKHNDLEDVGHDCYHHTFFEMLGNWSFGDYFKAEAITWAWELLTEVWGLPKNRLHVTVFGGDEADGLEPDSETEQMWKDLTDVEATHIHHGGKKDNFWEMGETGPCGPCSEIHIDLTENADGADLINADDPRAIELWNLVFIQFNRSEDRTLSPLPLKHVDTGLGLERVGAVINGKKSNYATDLFVPIIEKIETLTDHRYGQKIVKNSGADRFDIISGRDNKDIACRVIADHARTLSFAIADGVIPSNEGRGYVIRRILRRAARYGRQYLNIEGPFMVELVDTVVELMGDTFGELIGRADYIKQTIREEEESFGRTLDRGIDLFQRQADKLKTAGKKQLSGEVAFDLYATYGFPIDLTQIMAEERGMTVDMDGYDKAMADHRETSSAGAGAFKTEALVGLPATDDSAKFCREPIEAKVQGLVVNGSYTADGELSPGDEAAVVLDRTNFYGEQGGQVGDTGRLTWADGAFAVTNTAVAGQCVLHLGKVEAGLLRPGQQVLAEVAADRFNTMRNHTATHLLNWALAEVLGEHVNQAGSVVEPGRLRFDFTHNQAVTAEQLAEVERLANERVLADEPVSVQTMPLDEAKKISGVRAVFGEKYPDPVRVVAMGSGDVQAGSEGGSHVEFCGGTHLDRTSQVGLIKIISEESVAKGVRRITAVTGPGALKWVQQTDEIIRTASAALRAPASELPDRISAMQKEIKQLRKRPAGGAGGEEFSVRASIDCPTGKVLVGQVSNADAKAMRSICDIQRQKGAAAVFIGGTDGAKVTLTAMVSDELVKAGSMKAGDWVKAVAPIVGGGGGGKPTLAQAGGKQPDKLQEALETAANWAKDKLG